MFAFRHALTRNDLARHAVHAKKARLTVAVTGASGLVGSALIPFLTTGGHTVRPVKRKGTEFDAKALEGADVVVNLAGAGVADERWTDDRKRLLIDSRIDYTRRLQAALKQSGSRPRVWLGGCSRSASTAIVVTSLTETSKLGEPNERGAGFLAKLCQDWEAAGQEATALGARVVSLRTGIVQSANGGALSKFLRRSKRESVDRSRAGRATRAGSRSKTCSGSSCSRPTTTRSRGRSTAWRRTR